VNIFKVEFAMVTARDQKLFIDMLPEPMLFVTPGGVVVTANRAASDLLRRRETELVRSNLCDLIAEAPARLLSYLGRCSRGRQFSIARFTFKRPGDAEVQCRCEGALFLRRSDRSEAILLVRQRLQTEAATRFVALNDQIATLNRTRHRLEAVAQMRTSALVAAQTALQELSARLMQAQDQERRRLARELHDSTGQLLTAIQLNLSMMLDGKEQISGNLREHLSETVALTNQVIGEVRTVSHLLHPPLLDEAGLPLALQSFVDGFEERSDIAVSMDVAPTFSRASLELETAVFRIVQECLTNIHRHSGSKIATIALSEQEGVVRLEVRDEGCGIPGEVFDDQNGAKFKRGVGLRGMQERVRLLGGVIDFSDANPGTRIRVGLPHRRASTPIAQADPEAVIAPN